MFVTLEYWLLKTNLTYHSYFNTVNITQLQQHTFVMKSRRWYTVSGGKGWLLKKTSCCPAWGSMFPFLQLLFCSFVFVCKNLVNEIPLVPQRGKKPQKEGRSFLQHASCSCVYLPNARWSSLEEKMTVPKYQGVFKGYLSSLLLKRTGFNEM